MCYGKECEFYFVDDLENQEYCLNEEKCAHLRRKMTINFPNELTKEEKDYEF